MGYWEKRQKQLNSQLEKDEAKLNKRLSSFYDSEYTKLEKQIAAYYQQYGTENVIQYRTLMESLPNAERILLLEQMNEFAEKYPQYKELMPIRESIYRLNRLEGLQYSVRMQQLKIGAVENELIMEHLKRQAVKGGNMAAEAMGFGKNFYTMSSSLVEKCVNVAWANGENFSQKIWKNTEKLANYLNTDIAQALARGDSYEKLARNLRTRFSNVTRNDSQRLIYTEGTFVMAESSMQPFTESFDEYSISTVGDGNVCKVCSGMEGIRFKIDDRKPGVNFPPFHPWCRCTFTIEVEDWDKWTDNYEKNHGTSGKHVKNSMNDRFSESSDKYRNGLSDGTLTQRCQRATEINNKYTIRPSKWSGNVVVDNAKCKRDRISGRKLWSCDILLRSGCQDRTIIHEDLHARSGSYLTPLAVIPYLKIEECSVELLAREICKAEKIPYLPNSNKYVEILYEINSIARICDSDLDFATALFAKSLKTRYNWLNKQINKAIENKVLSKENRERLLYLVLKLKGR